jgi:hypothetical protein
MRALNHATIRRDAYTWPADVDAVVAELHLTAARMHQALEQAHRWLQRAHNDESVGHDQSRDLDALGLNLDGRFAAAESVAEQLVGELGNLHEFTAHLTGIPTANDSAECYRPDRAGRLRTGDSLDDPPAPAPGL